MDLRNLAAGPDRRYQTGRLFILAAGIIPLSVGVYHACAVGGSMVSYLANAAIDGNYAFKASNEADYYKALMFTNVPMLIAHLVCNSGLFIFFGWRYLVRGAKGAWWVLLINLTILGFMDSLSCFVFWIKTGKILAVPMIPLVIGWAGLLLCRRVVFEKETAP